MFIYFFKILMIILILLGLIILSIKIDNMSVVRKNKYVKILDITSINRQNSIVTLKIGEEGVILGVTPSSINKIGNLNKEDILNMEQSLNENKRNIDNKIIFMSESLKKIVSRRKRD